MRQFFKTSSTLVIWVFLLCNQSELALAKDKGDTKPVSIEWRVAQDQVDDVKKIVPLREVQAYDTRNPVLIGAIVLVGAAVLPQIAQAVLDVYYRYKSGGVIIDLTKEPMLISTNAHIAPGFAVIISKSETKLVEVGGVKPLKVEDLLPLLKVPGLKG